MSNTSNSPPLGRAALLVLAAVLTFAPAQASAATLSGGVNGQPEASVELRLKKHRLAGAQFDASAISLSCDDDTKQTIDFPRLRVRALGDDRFEAHYYKREANGDQTYLSVEGHLDGKRASGRIFALIDLASGVDDPSRPDCWSYPRTWRAQ